MGKALVIERDAVLHNIRIVRAKAGGAEVIGVLKDNAYGFGLIEMARLLREGGICSFAVTEPTDLARLRDAGFQEETILVLRSTSLPSEIETMIDCAGTATFGSYEAAVAANGIAESMGMVLSAHIELDTGMGRYGFLPSESDKVLSIFRYMKNIHITGMYTHFYGAFFRGGKGEKTVRSQLAAFESVVGQVREASFDPGLLHAANSPALFRFPFSLLGGVRVGSALTGRLLAKGSFDLRRVGYAECPVVETRWLTAGASVGYGASWRTKKPVRIAVVPFGYADGFLLEKARDRYTPGRTFRYMLQELKTLLVGKRPSVLVNGKRCRVLGHVGMLHTVCDVTDTDVAPGDVARFEVNPLLAGNILPKRYV